MRQFSRVRILSEASCLLQTLNAKDLNRFAPINLDPEAAPGFPKIIDAIAREDALRTNFLKACLSKLGLKVNQDENAVPSLSRLHFTSSQPGGTAAVMAKLQDLVTVEGGEQYIKDENDAFHLEKPEAWASGSHDFDNSERADADISVVGAEDRILDYSTIVKRLVVHEKDFPASKETPYFNHHSYYSNLRHYQSQEPYADVAFGSNVLYGEVVTSTNTMLEK